MDVAQYNLARCFEFNYKKLAAYWMSLAATQEYPPALEQMGDYYYRGYGIKENLDKAEEYYHRAVDLGNQQALKKIEPVRKWLRKYIDFMENV